MTVAQVAHLVIFLLLERLADFIKSKNAVSKEFRSFPTMCYPIAMYLLFVCFDNVEYSNFEYLAELTSDCVLFGTTTGILGCLYGRSTKVAVAGNDIVSCTRTVERNFLFELLEAFEKLADRGGLIKVSQKTKIRGNEEEDNKNIASVREKLSKVIGTFKAKGYVNFSELVCYFGHVPYEVIDCSIPLKEVAFFKDLMEMFKSQLHNGIIPEDVLREFCRKYPRVPVDGNCRLYFQRCQERFFYSDTDILRAVTGSFIHNASKNVPQLQEAKPKGANVLYSKNFKNEDLLISDISGFTASHINVLVMLLRFASFMEELGPRAMVRIPLMYDGVVVFATPLEVVRCYIFLTAFLECVIPNEPFYEFEDVNPVSVVGDDDYDKGVLIHIPLGGCLGVAANLDVTLWSFLYGFCQFNEAMKIQHGHAAGIRSKLRLAGDDFILSVGFKDRSLPERIERVEAFASMIKCFIGELKEPQIVLSGDTNITEVKFCQKTVKISHFCEGNDTRLVLTSRGNFIIPEVLVYPRLMDKFVGEEQFDELDIVQAVHKTSSQVFARNPNEREDIEVGLMNLIDIAYGIKPDDNAHFVYVDNSHVEFPVMLYQRKVAIERYIAGGGVFEDFTNNLILSKTEMVDGILINESKQFYRAVSTGDYLVVKEYPTDRLIFVEKGRSVELQSNKQMGFTQVELFTEEQRLEVKEAFNKLKDYVLPVAERTRYFELVSRDKRLEFIKNRVVQIMSPEACELMFE